MKIIFSSRARIPQYRVFSRVFVAFVALVKQVDIQWDPDITNPEDPSVTNHINKPRDSKMYGIVLRYSEP